MILVTHDLGVVAEVCDTVLVMYGGVAAEYAGVDTIFNDPQHPYTQRLLNAFPDLTKPDDKLTSIPGYPPRLDALPARLSIRPSLPGCSGALPYPGAGTAPTWRVSLGELPFASTHHRPMSDTPILQVQALRKLFPVKQTGIGRSPQRFVHAVDGVSFDLGRGEVLALVGESGCGKSTLALTLMGLETPTAGSIVFEGRDVTNLTGKDQKQLRRRIQMVFQDPYESLNPLMTVGEIIAEPLQVHRLGDRQTGTCGAFAACTGGCRPEAGRHLPQPLSARALGRAAPTGGDRRRAGAGASPALADEPVSMLDVSIRAEILNLLAELRASRSISILFITHDLATAAHFTDRVAVMYLGRIVEIGPTRQVLAHPTHPYTKALLSVIPVPNPRQRHERIILQGDPPNPVDLPPGCRFHPRCPVAQAICRQQDPALHLVGDRQQTACLLV